MDKYLVYVNLEFSESGETMVNIRQSKMDGVEHIVTVSGADLAPLMYQLKSIETSLIFGSNLMFQQPQQRVQDDLAREIIGSVKGEYADEPLETLLVEEAPSTTKGHLRKRLCDTIRATVATSTDDGEKESDGAEGEKSKKKKKKKKDVITVNASTRAFANVLWGEIEQIVKRQCEGCSKNLMDHHDVCATAKAAKMRKFFNEALTSVDITKVEDAMDEILAEEGGDPSILTVYPTRSALQADKVWQSYVKKTILGA